jgi:hypothetical protein
MACLFKVTLLSLALRGEIYKRLLILLLAIIKRNKDKCRRMIKV